MAIFHYSAQIIKRSAGRSAIAAAAYRAGEKIEDRRTGLTHDYTRKSGIAHNEIMAPGNVPEWVYDRTELWNQVEAAEKRIDSQTAREINVALPVELTKEQNINLLRGYVKVNFVDRGMIADIAIHFDNPQNPHAHIMLTTREITPDGFGKKCRDWNPEFAYGKVKNADNYVDWRAAWQDHANSALENAGHDIKIDHRSYAQQGIDRLPTMHEGPHVRAMEERGIETEIGDRNRAIAQSNAELAETRQAQVVNLAEYRQAKQEYEREVEGWKHFNSRERAAVQRAQEIMENEDVTIDSLEGQLKSIASEQRLSDDAAYKMELQEQAKDIRRALAALRAVELKEFIALNSEEWPAVKYVEYYEMKSLKKAAEYMGEPITPENIKQYYDQVLESLDENKLAIAAYRQGIESIRMGVFAYQRYTHLQDELQKVDRFTYKVRNKETAAQKINSLKRESESLLPVMEKHGISNANEYASADQRIEILKDNESRLVDKVDQLAEEKTLLNRAVQAINSADSRKEILEHIESININFKHPDISEEDAKLLGDQLYGISEQINFRDRFKNIRYLSEPTKAQLYNLADWLLLRPAIKTHVDEYLTTQRELISNQYAYTARVGNIENSLNKSYSLLRDRVAQELKNHAVALLKYEHVNYRDFDNARGDSSDDNTEPRITIKPEKEAQEWFRKTHRSIERVAGQAEISLLPKELSGEEELVNALYDLGHKLPEHLKGAAVIAYLPDEAKEAAWRAADLILSQSELNRFGITEESPHYDTMRKTAAEAAIYHALRLMPRDIVKVEIITHEERAINALEKLAQANGSLVKNTPDEAMWTGIKLAEALRCLGAGPVEAMQILTRWGSMANFSTTGLEELGRHYLQTNPGDNLWRKEWHRLADNLGYREKDFLYPWMGVPEPAREAAEPKEQIAPPVLIEKNIPYVINAFREAACAPEDTEEIKWTVSTSVWVLKEMRVSPEENYIIVSDWARRANLEISEARLRDTIDRFYIKDGGSWLGRDNWERLFNNLGVTPPPNPWDFKGQSINYANIVWKAICRSVQQERAKSEAQGRAEDRKRRFKTRGREDQEQDRGRSL